jgi:hypothetical protein
MSCQPWLEQLRAELSRHRLPPLYAERLISELSDHITDSLEDPMSTDVRQDVRALSRSLGSPRDVAATAATQHQRAHFCRRHPLLSFVVLPLVALPLLWACAIAGFIALVAAAGYVRGGESADDLSWAGPLLPFVVGAMVLTPIAGAAAMFCRLARRAECGWKWPLAACFLLAVLSGPAMIDVGIRGPYSGGVLHGTRYTSTAPDARGFLSFGFGVRKHPTMVQLAQFALPLTIGAWAVCRQLNRRRLACAG